MTPNLRRVGAAICLGLIAAAPALVLAMPLGDEVAVVGPPGGSDAATILLIARAGGTLVRTGRFNIVVTRAASDRPDFVARLYAAGAWLVLDPFILGGCLQAAIPFPSRAG